MIKIILAAFLTLLSSPTWATVPNATPLFNQYNCNSSTTQFPYAFPITSTSDMTVYTADSLGVITQQMSTFSVDTTNVWVNYPLVGSPCPTGSTITLVPSTPQTQITAYGNRAPFTATAVGASFDKITLIAQQLQGQINRAFLQPINFTGTATFPSSSPGNYIGWNGSGNLANIPSPANAALWTLSGANAVYNLGNVSTSGSMTATGGFVGALTGNASTATSATTAGTVTTAAQPTITSVGTLTGLIVSGNLGIGSTTPGKSLDVQGTVRATNFSGGIVGTQTTSATVFGGSGAILANTAYHALTDGEFICIVATNSSGSNYVQISTDASVSPGTLVGYLQGTGQNLSSTVIVKKGNYLECVPDGASTLNVAWWIPLG